MKKNYLKVLNSLFTIYVMQSETFHHSNNKEHDYGFKLKAEQKLITVVT